MANTHHRSFLESAAENPLNYQAQANIERIESAMSGTSLQATEESDIEISPQATTGNSLRLTQSEIFNTTSIMSSIAAMASQHFV